MQLTIFKFISLTSIYFFLSAILFVFVSNLKEGQDLIFLTDYLFLFIILILCSIIYKKGQKNILISKGILKYTLLFHVFAAVVIVFSQFAGFIFYNILMIFYIAIFWKIYKNSFQSPLTAKDFIFPALIVLIIIFYVNFRMDLFGGPSLFSFIP